MDLFGKRNQIILHLPSKFLHHTASIAVSLHPVISKRKIVFIPQLFRLCGTVFDQFVIDILYLILIFHKEMRVFFPGLSPDGSVLIMQIGCHKRQVKHIVLPRNLRLGKNIIISGTERVFFLHKFYKLRTHRTHCKFNVFEGHRPYPVLQIRPER